METNLRENILEALEKLAPVRRDGKGWMTRCPNPDHEDRHPSFHVYPGGGGTIYHLSLLLQSRSVQVMAELERERRDNCDCWVLEQWRQVSIPEWRRVLQDSIEQHDSKREDYARWMLSEILFDPEYGKSEK